MNKKLTKRILLGTGLGVLFGFLCFAGFSSKPDIPADTASLQVWSWSNVWMWGTVANRAALGLLVALGGVMIRHPWLGFRLYPILRGAKLGAIASLPMAIGSLANANHDMEVSGFWIVLVFGTIIGAIIDIVITKFIGDGSVLCDEDNN